MMIDAIVLVTIRIADLPIFSQNNELTATPGWITVENPKRVSRGVSRISLDGALLPGDALVPLSDDGGEHRVEVVLGSTLRAAQPDLAAGGES